MMATIAAGEIRSLNGAAPVNALYQSEVRRESTWGGHTAVEL